MGYSYKAVFNKDNRKNKTGFYSIQIRVTVDRQTRYFSLDLKIEEKHWAGKENRWIKDSSPFAFEMNSLINKKIDALRKFELRQKLFNNPITLDGIAQQFQKKDDPGSFNEYVSTYIKTVTGKAEGTLKKYRTFEGYLNEFNKRISFGHLSEPLFQSFAQWLTKKGMIGVTVHKYFDPFKVIVKRAVKDGYLEKDPFQYVRLDIKPTKGKRVYLELEEITLLKNAKLPAARPDLEKVREHWLFCFYAAFYYSDLRELTWASVKNTDYGPCIVADRYKNENSFIAPVHKFSLALQILDRQRGKDPELVFPDLISEQHFNAKLKDLAKEAGIKKNLMNKTARHSAIQFWESQGLETQHTSKMVGHTKESTTKNYYELSVRDINKRVERFDFTKIGI